MIDKDLQELSDRKFIEYFPVKDNKGKPREVSNSISLLGKKAGAANLKLVQLKIIILMQGFQRLRFFNEGFP
jgi:hypothetical protein